MSAPSMIFVGFLMALALLTFGISLVALGLGVLPIYVGITGLILSALTGWLAASFIDANEA